MPACSPQRYLANNRNLLRAAVALTLTPSSVRAVEDLVVEEPLARVGSAAVELTGAYDGAEEAEYEIEVLGTAGGDPTISAVVNAGAGSSRLIDLAATGLEAQDIAVELVDAGRPALRAAVNFEGVTLQARELGAVGNALRIIVDQSGLTFTPTQFALLVDLKAGDGGSTSGLEGAGFNWSTAVLGADNLIPASAKRIAFGDDHANIYLQYKAFADNTWRYYFVPALKRDVPKGTPIMEVTGGRVVTITNGTDTETYTGVATVYDFLSQVRASSALVTVEGVVALDRSPEGQASRELLVRTDAHVEVSYGEGSEAAVAGMEDTFANSNALTELVIARCYATTGRDHPLAHVGAERWEVSSSLGGKIGEAVSGEPFVDPNGRFGFTIPQRFPPGYGNQKGRFELVSTHYEPRNTDAGEIEPPICVGGMRLGPAAVDKTLTLVWTKRPSGECGCDNLPVPPIGGPCLGDDPTEGTTMADYSSEAIPRLKDLYDWGATCAASAASYVAGKERDGIPETTQTITYYDGGLAGLAGARGVTPNGAAGPGQGETSYAPYGTNLTGADFDFSADLNLEDTKFPDDVPAQIHTIFDMYERALQLIDAVPAGSPDYRGAGFTQWDSALATLEADTASIGRTKGFTIEKYRALTKQALAYAGISSLGKSDASIVESGDGCWRDVGHSHYFTVEDSDGGGYAPLFANTVYYSARRAKQEGAYFATHEFGLIVNIACPQKMKVGDAIVLSIGDAAWPSTYQNGDTMTLPVIAAQDLYLAGGRDDDATQTWSVTGSEHGPFAPWIFTPGHTTGSLYSDGGLTFDIEQRGIPNAKGDRYLFSIERGEYQWRKDGGAWNGPLPISTVDAALDSGLMIRFAPGAAPSFEAGDLYRFTALQPWAVSNVRSSPAGKRWQWAESSVEPELLIDFGASKVMDAIALADHTIPAGATITLEGGDAAPGEWSEAVTWREGLAVEFLSQVRSARYVRLTLTDAGAGYIGWIFLGEALATALAANVQLKRSAKIARASGPLYEGGSTLGRGRTAIVRWTEAALEEDDGQALMDLFDHLKANNDEPFVFVSHVNRPQDAVYGRIVDDETDFEEISDEQRNDTALRRYSGSMTVRGVWARA